jgi:hypothetical protein
LDLDLSPFGIKIHTHQPIESNKLHGLIDGLTTGYHYDILGNDFHELDMIEGDLVSNPHASLAIGIYVALDSSKTLSLGDNFETQINAPQSTMTLAEVSKFFRGDSYTLPRNLEIGAKFRNFEDWTSVSEEKHLSLWLYALLSYLLPRSIQIGKEVDIPLKGYPRPGRLDACGIYKDKLLNLEAKISIKDAVKDQRYRSQIPEYNRAIATTILKSSRPELMFSNFLVVGASEFDLRVESDTLHSTVLGKEFLKQCRNSEIKFITSNALWCLLMGILAGAYDFEEVRDFLFFSLDDDEILGLTSAGTISNKMQITHVAFK